MECLCPTPHLAPRQGAISGGGFYHRRSGLPFPLPMSLAVPPVVSNAAQLLVKKGSLPPHTPGLAGERRECEYECVERGGSRGKRSQESNPKVGNENTEVGHQRDGGRELVWGRFR